MHKLLPQGEIRYRKYLSSPRSFQESNLLHLKKGKRGEGFKEEIAFQLEAEG